MEKGFYPILSRNSDSERSYGDMNSCLRKSPLTVYSPSSIADFVPTPTRPNGTPNNSTPTPPTISSVYPRSASEASLDTTASKFRQLPCRTFISVGTCPYRERCVYLHDPRIICKEAKTKTRKKNKDDTVLDALFWPVLPVEHTCSKLDNNGQPHVIQQYNVPIPQNDRYQQHDQSLYSLWMHFVDYCIVTTEATKQFNNNYQAILTAASRGDHESVNNMLPCYSALDDYYNKHTNLPRLSVFVALSRANGKEYNSDELTEEMVKIEKETCEIEHGNSVPKVSLQFTKRSQNSTDQKSNLNRSFRNANSNNKREEFIKSSWCKNYDLCSNHYCKTESEFCNYDEYNGLSKMDHTLVQGNKSEYFDANFTSKEDYLPFPHINYPKIAKRDSNNLKYREDFTSNGMLYSEDKRYPLERTFSTDSLSSRDSFVSYNPNCAPATICDEFHYNLLRESFGMTDRESKSVDRFHCDKQIVLRHNPSPIQCLQSSKGIATGYDREIIFEDNFEMDCSIDRELMNIITPNFLKCEDGNHNFILGGLNASTTSATKALSPTANEFVPSQW